MHWAALKKRDPPKLGEHETSQKIVPTALSLKPGLELNRINRIYFLLLVRLLKESFLYNVNFEHCSCYNIEHNLNY